MSSNDTAILSWNNATIQLNRYFSIFIFLFGIIGNILNILVLSQRNLRSNPCAFLFLASSIASLIAIISGLFTRTTSGWAIDLTNTITWLCQLRTFVVFVSRTIAYCLIALATIDRWLSSCFDHRRRQMSTIINAQRGMIIILIFSCLLYVQMFYCYEANLINAPLKCYGKTITCRLITDLTYAFVANIFPLIIMLYFGLMTIINIRQSKRRIQIINMTSISRVTINISQRSKKTDYYLLYMLFVQVILFGIFTLPQNIQKFIALAQSNQIKTALDSAIENFIFNFFLLFAYLANGMSFYIYTLSGGSVFRNELIKLAQTVRQIF
ncbi:unnamed protein product [Rotaria sordida]|uniref:G-protein coupled receptors family 1 profile domain-containing protein n=1 Tax=Rotaria sordida TaxID=392033 RepID=A0A819K484_9BILA|nr:unnamed protein product [Rotaria sordida]CAF3940830.1 unnamed protein product [Rotaria sordida]